jgi:tryptophan synthase alpha subunit
MQVSVVGVTGARATVNPRVKDLLKEIRQVCIKEIQNNLVLIFYQEEIRNLSCFLQTILNHISLLHVV